MFVPKTIHTERLALTPTTQSDAEFLIELLNSPKWLQNIGDRNIKTIPQATKYIEERIVAQFDRLGYGNYTVVRKSDGVKMGSCGLYDRPGLEGVDIGFAFLPQFEGKGYGFESAQAILAHVAENFELNQVCAITLPKNKPSQRLLEKLGLSYIKMVTIPPSTDELMLYQIDL